MVYVNQSYSGTDSDQINEQHKRRIRYASLKITCLLPAKALTRAVICSILIKGSDDYRKKSTNDEVNDLRFAEGCISHTM